MHINDIVFINSTVNVYFENVRVTMTSAIDKRSWVLFSKTNNNSISYLEALFISLTTISFHVQMMTYGFAPLFYPISI